MKHFSAAPVFAALLLTAMGNCFAYDDETPDLIMQRVSIAQSSADAEATIVNILISKRKIVLVSEDEVPADEQTIVKDASGGYLIGRIGIGSAADFIILDVNPAENIRNMSVVRIHDGQRSSVLRTKPLRAIYFYRRALGQQDKNRMVELWWRVPSIQQVLCALP